MKEIGKLKSYKLKIKVLKPVFIGGPSDEDLSNLNYYFDRRTSTLNIIDEAKFSKYLLKTGKLRNFENFVLTNKNAKIFNWFKENNINGSALDIYSRSLKIEIQNEDDDEYNNSRKSQFGQKKQQKKYPNDIKMFVKSLDGKPYIPGSTIKGAIRQAILSHEILANKQKYSKYWEDLNIIIREVRPNFDHIINSIEQEAFSMGEFKNAQIDSVFRGLEISDSNLINPDQLFIAQRKDYNFENTKDKTTHSLPIWREYLKTYTEANITMTIDSSIFPYSINELNKILEEYAKFQNEIIQDHFVLPEKIFLPFDIIDKKTDVTPNLCIGGGNGFILKSIIYQIAPSYEEARKFVARLLDKKFIDFKTKTPMHNHEGRDKRVSPRAYKLVKEGYDYLPIGWCYISEDK